MPGRVTPSVRLETQEWGFRARMGMGDTDSFTEMAVGLAAAFSTAASKLTSLKF